MVGVDFSEPHGRRTTLPRRVGLHCSERRERKRVQTMSSHWNLISRFGISASKLFGPWHLFMNIFRWFFPEVLRFLCDTKSLREVT